MRMMPDLAGTAGRPHAFQRETFLDRQTRHHKILPGAR